MLRLGAATDPRCADMTTDSEMEVDSAQQEKAVSTLASIGKSATMYTLGNASVNVTKDKF